MKKAIVISVDKAKFAPILFPAQLEQGFAAAAELGFDGVELAIRDTRAIDRDGIRALAERHGLEVPAMGTGQAFGEEGLSFSDPEPEVRDRADRRVRDHIELCAQWGTMLIIGLIRGRLPQDPEGYRAGEELAVRGITRAAEFADSRGVTILLEPINRYETNFLNNSDQAAELIQRIGAPNLKLLLDVFHMNIEERSIIGALERRSGLIGHVHMVDSNREAPGRGHLDIPNLIRTLKSGGYDGYLSMEMLPVPDHAQSARIAIENLKRFGA